MRAIRNIQDAEVALRDIFDHLDRLKTKPQNLNLNQIKNMGDALDPQDAVTLKQMNTAIVKGLSTTFSYIKTVDFVNSKVTTGKITLVNGVITGVT